MEGEREVSSVGAGCGATYVEGGKKRPGANGFKDTVGRGNLKLVRSAAVQYNVIWFFVGYFSLF